MSIFLPSNQLSVAHQRRIDKLVCAMHQDRMRLLALEADAGFPERAVEPVRVVISARRYTLLERAFGWLGSIQARVPSAGWASL